MKKRAICFLFVAMLGILFSAIAHGAEEGLHRFYLQYAIVQHSLKGEKGCFDQLMDLHDKNPHASNMIAKFWYKKALMINDKEMKELISEYSKKIDAEKKQSKKDEIEKELFNKMDELCFIYYFDNWDAINKMILDRLSLESK